MISLKKEKSKKSKMDIPMVEEMEESYYPRSCICRIPSEVMDKISMGDSVTLKGRVVGRSERESEDDFNELTVEFTEIEPSKNIKQNPGMDEDEDHKKAFSQYSKKKED